MLNRRRLLQALAAVAVPLRWLGIQKKKAQVQVLEFVGAETRYKTQWEFDTEEEALEFVRSLTPTLLRLWTSPKNQEITEMDVAIVSKKDPEKILVYGWDCDGELGTLFWGVSVAWTYLMTMMVNGKHVSRPGGKGSNLSEYLVHPFWKGKPEIINGSKYAPPFVKMFHIGGDA